MYFLDERGFYDDWLDREGRRLSCLSGRVVSLGGRVVTVGHKVSRGVEVTMACGPRNITLFFDTGEPFVRDAMRFLILWFKKAARPGVTSFVFREGNKEKSPALLIVYDSEVLFPVRMNLSV